MVGIFTPTTKKLEYDTNQSFHTLKQVYLNTTASALKNLSLVYYPTDSIQLNIKNTKIKDPLEEYIVEVNLNSFIFHFYINTCLLGLHPLKTKYL